MPYIRYGPTENNLTTGEVELLNNGTVRSGRLGTTPAALLTSFTTVVNVLGALSTQTQTVRNYLRAREIHRDLAARGFSSITLNV